MNIQNFGSTLITIGLILLVLGVIFQFLPKGTFPRLPGDILIQKDNFTFYFPIVTAILLSVVLTIILRIFSK